MQARWPEAEVTGLDSSAEMLREAAAGGDTVKWKEADIARWTPQQPVDVVYSNAALHWLPDHDALLPRLVSFLAPGGVLAIQMPLSWSEPSHVLMRETLRTGESGGTSLGPESLRARLSRRWVAEPAAYYSILAPLVESVDIWTTRYLQVLSGPEPVFEWVKGTGLRPVLETLEGAEREQFLTQYRKRLLEVYPPNPDGTTLYPFPRLFIVARAAA
jgi:trans-aconitate 2-methyltransferase